MKSIAVSIIVPIYNVEEYLPRCIDSILAQTFTDFELILVDDGSPDCCSQICDDYAQKDNRIKVIHKENGGVSSSRNTGIDSAIGKYICFVDSDDWIEKKHIENMIKQISDSDCVIEGYTKDTLYDSNPSYLKFENINMYNLNDINSKEVFWNGYIHSSCNKLFKRNIIIDNNIKFEQDIHISEDSLFCIEYLSCCENIVISENVTYHYCSNGQNSTLSKKVYADTFDTYKKVYFSLKCLLERGNCTEACKNEILIRTTYPQLYATVLKIVFNDKMSKKEKKKLLSKMEKDECCMQVMYGARKYITSKGEKLTLFLVNRKQYTLLKTVLNLIRINSK